jgi:hypothetical protein
MLAHTSLKNDFHFRVLAYQRRACAGWRLFGSMCNCLHTVDLPQRLRGWGTCRKGSDMTVPAETSTCDRLQILRYCGGVGFTPGVGRNVCLTPQIRLGLPTHPVAAGRHE